MELGLDLEGRRSYHVASEGVGGNSEPEATGVSWRGQAWSDLSLGQVPYVTWPCPPGGGSDLWAGHLKLDPLPVSLGSVILENTSRVVLRALLKL